MSVFHFYLNAHVTVFVFLFIYDFFLGGGASKPELLYGYVERKQYTVLKTYIKRLNFSSNRHVQEI